MELTVVHDGKEWIAFDQDKEFRGTSLEEMDDQIRDYVLKSGRVGKGQRLKVWMYFNTAVIPEWMRQYMQHYFNRVLIIEN
ncbi:hypothetical protein SAMN04488516_10715 [Desulfonauticus submarinus]|uniref:Uncharacterized protein n=1 Tax=Desulfonauticus submarinus TaxID=206665 RepID=A0A1H0E892_9BACT|nr:DUF5395 family protein [Desulfonauticus submarinus]SDN78528.1 hypothetical protein SAMN04488516_10715 [Desulfonauticus submarinus]